MKQLVVLILCAMVVSTGYAAGKKAAAKKLPPEMTVTGYLVDVNSAEKMMAESDHVAMQAKAHERTVCLQPDNVASGFGVFVIVPRSTTHASDVDFYKFNAAGNKMALDMLQKSTDKDNLLVTVNGKATFAVHDISWSK